MADQREHLTWASFRESIALRVPAIHRARGNPNVDLFVDENGERIGVRIPFDEAQAVPASRLALVNVSSAVLDDHVVLEVTTRARSLFREFFAFANALIDQLQVEGTVVTAVIDATLDSWRQLLRPIAVLSDERIIGLWGELWLVHRLVTATGPIAVRAWTGPLAEPHDFRLTGFEIEVKSTRSPERTHLISSLAQLEPSAGHALGILSLQLEPPGTSDALTLPMLAAQIRELLAFASEDARTFEDCLLRAGYLDEHAMFYDEGLRLRTKPVLVPVDNDFPRITRAQLLELLAENQTRIRDVQYRVNVEGLGWPDLTPEFLAHIPGGPL